MLDYLTEIMQNSHNFSWNSVKGVHAVLLCQMEEGRVRWDETKKIDRIRRAHAQKMNSLQGVKRTHSRESATPCCYYQKGTCSQKIDYEVNGHMYLHVCSTCLQQGKSLITH